MPAAALLGRLREARGFDAALVAQSKIGRLVEWMKEEKLDAAVVGVSGGVDSALVLALLVHASKLPESPLRRVVALLLPFGQSRGATTQGEATSRGRLVAQALGLADDDVWEAPLDDSLKHTLTSIEKAAKLHFASWAEGQCLSVMRTPALYGAVALLREACGHRAVVFGTTNRDEGAYLGFFGKASDGMVDVQLIADLHKSEVRTLAAHLGVPEEIVSATPRGDVHDGRSDQEMIGATYDEIETYLRLRENERDVHDLASAGAIEELHAINRHKYRVGSPAVHLDVLPRGVPGGAVDTLFSGREETRPPTSAVPGAWEPSSTIALDPCASRLPTWTRIPLSHAPHALAIRIHEALTAGDAARLRDAMEIEAASIAEPVGVTGVKGTDYDGGVGSMRATAWAPALARELYTRIRPALPAIRFLDNDSFTDAFATETRLGHRTWRLVGLTPLLRFMKYAAGGEHLCHYDAAYDYGDGRRTLLSVVFYLTNAREDGSEGGATRFLRDGQEHLPTFSRSFADWTRPTTDADVVASVLPKEGDVLVFDHRLGHDVQRWQPHQQDAGREIIRADVVYEAVPDGGRLAALF